MNIVKPKTNHETDKEFRRKMLDQAIALRQDELEAVERTPELNAHTAIPEIKPL